MLVFGLLMGRGQSSIVGPIRVAKGSSEHWKWPFATPDFKGLRVSDLLSRQRSAFHMDEKSPSRTGDPWLNRWHQA